MARYINSAHLYSAFVVSLTTAHYTTFQPAVIHALVTVVTLQ